MPIRVRRLAVAALVGVALFTTACSSDGEPGEPIALDDGGILISPPDVLEGDPIEAGGALPPPVDGLQPTPEVDFVWFDGTDGSTAAFTGTPTVVNFWASNCAPCIAEMPEFEEVHQALGDRVAFVGMNVADTRAEADRLAERTGVTYRLADDGDSRVFRAFQGFVMPTTALLNPQGQVAFVWSGVLTGDELRSLIDEHILPGSL